jgi:hypothetical protein
MAHTALPRKRIAMPARELASYHITAQVVDHLMNPIPGANLTTMELTVYAEDSGHTLINNNDHVNILNNAQGTIDSGGNLVIHLAPADNPILDDSQSEEIHVALVEWTYNAGFDSGWQELEFRVRNKVREP